MAVTAAAVTGAAAAASAAPATKALAAPGNPSAARKGGNGHPHGDQTHDHPHPHPHGHGDHARHGQIAGWRDLLAMGVSGGLTPYRVAGVRAISYYWCFVSLLAVPVVLTQVSPSL